MSELNMNVFEPHDIYVDNKQCVSFSKNITVNSKLRTTFNLKEKRIQEMRDDKIVNIKHVNGIENVHCTLYIVHCAFCTLYIVHCTLYIAHCTLYKWQL